MPSITPQTRASIGGQEAAPSLPRASMKVQTGMNAPVQKTDPTLTDPTKVGQPTTTEDTKAPAVTLSPQLTALSRKQQALQREIQAQREKEAAFESQKANYIPKSDFIEKFGKTPLDALKELGMTYEQFNEAVLAQLNGADPVKELRSEVENLKKSQEENTNKQYEATLKQYKAETDALVASDPKAFHLINKGNHQDAVVQHIVETWQDNPDNVLTVAQAAKEVEDVLRENAKAYAEALKELEPKPTETQAEPAKKILPPPKTAVQAPKTLTEQVETPPQPRSPGQFQHMSTKERIAAAIERAQRRG